MKRSLLAVLALGAAVLAAPAAHADDSDFMYGDCSFDSPDQSLTTTGTYSGWIGVRSVTTTGYANPRLIGATVTCWIEVNGVVAAGTTHSYGDLPGVPGVQAGMDPATYTTTDALDNVQVCESVAYADSTFRSHCIYNDLQMPSHRQQEYINQIVTTGFAQLDPAICPQLAAHAGSYPGGVTIGPDGDLRTDAPDPLGLGTNNVYDCPPY